ncbi:hypothetical protein C0995_009649, partial [Termitomyces sp. Mi166
DHLPQLQALHDHEPNLPTQAEHHAPIPEAQEPKQHADELHVAQEGHEVVRAIGGVRNKQDREEISGSGGGGGGGGGGRV